MGQRFRRVEQADGSAGDQRLEPCGGVVQVGVGLGDELLEGEVQPVGLGLEAAVADDEGAVDGDEDEEGPAGEEVEDGFVVDVCCYEAGAPAFGYEVEEGFDGGEGVGL